MSNELFVGLRILDFKEAPEGINRIMGVRPTDLIVKGTKKGTSNTRNKESCWEYGIKTSSLLDLNKNISLILKKFKGKENRISKLGKERILFCVAYVHNRDMIFNISSKNLSILAKMGCSFDLDYYILPEKK